jgi:hypothetical protein
VWAFERSGSCSGPESHRDLRGPTVAWRLLPRALPPSVSCRFGPLQPEARRDLVWPPEGFLLRYGWNQPWFPLVESRLESDFPDELHRCSWCLPRRAEKRPASECPGSASVSRWRWCLSP